MKPDINIYTPEGWLDVPAMVSTGAWCFVMIGPRQVGKTFGTLKYLLDNDCQHIYMRRTIDELGVITDDPDLNPYAAMEEAGYFCELQKCGKGWIVGDYDPNDENRKIIKKRGIGLPLSRIAKLRGFQGSRYTDVVLDEFIPEEIVVTRKAEGDAFRNALVTIAGNRVKLGKPPLRVWMLANANNLFSPIMIRMNLVPQVEQMANRGEEWRLTKDGVFIALPKSDQVINERLEKDPMLRHLNDNSAFAAMAFNNEFAYNNVDKVRPQSTKGMIPFAKVGELYIWQRKNDGPLYASATAAFTKASDVYKDDKDSLLNFQWDYPAIGLIYRKGWITFDSAVSMWKFRNYIGLKD